MGKLKENLKEEHKNSNEIDLNDENLKNKDKNKELKKIKRLIIILFLLLFLLVSGIGFAIYTVIKNKEVEETYVDLDAKLGILPGMSLEEIQNRLNQVVEEGMVNISINPEPEFENGSAKGNLRIENVAANHYDYIVTITLDDTGEEIYKSGVISPGYYVDEAKLTKELPKGDYNATAVFKAYEQETKNIIGTVAVTMVIHILN